jgi:Tol biopolymer transport system component
MQRVKRGGTTNHEATMRRRSTMLQRYSALAFVILLVAVSVSAAGAQSVTPTVTQLFTIDSADVSSPAVSSDGRWIAYSQHRTASESDLFVRPSSGGAATQVTPSVNTYKSWARFSPAGDRIVYGSMTSDNGSDLRIMAVPFDARTGKAAGAPRQVTLDVVRKGAMAISPDGKWIAYIMRDSQRLRIVPINGGNARTIAEYAHSRADLANIVWTDDGSAVLYAVTPPGARYRALMRVPAAGGRATELRRSTEGFGMLAPGGHRAAIAVSFGKSNRQRELRILGEDGSIVQRVRLPDNVYFPGWTWSPDGRAIVGAISDAPAVVRIASTSGGPVRTLTSGTGYDFPVGWSADSRTVYYMSNNVPTLGAVTTDGVHGTPLQPADGGEYTAWEGVVGRYVLSTFGKVGDKQQHVIAHNLDDGKSIEITATKYAAGRWYTRGAGGTYSIDGNAYLYFQHVGTSMALYRVVPGERSHVLATFPDSLAGRVGIAVQDGRVIYSQRARDSIRFVFAAVGTPGKVIATIPAGEGAGEIAWTRDGRHVAFGGPGSSIYTLALTADGTPAEAPQRYQLPFEYRYELSFLNDGRRLTMIAQPRGGANAVVALVSLHDPSRPVILSEADSGSAWDHLMSPDGQWTAYPAELPTKGSTIYRVDLSGLARTASAPKP